MIKNNRVFLGLNILIVDVFLLFFLFTIDTIIYVNTDSENLIINWSFTQKRGHVIGLLTFVDKFLQHLIFVTNNRNYNFHSKQSFMLRQVFRAYYHSSVRQLRFKSAVHRQHNWINQSCFEYISFDWNEIIFTQVLITDVKCDMW